MSSFLVSLQVLKKEDINIEELDLKINSYVNRCNSQVEKMSIIYRSKLDYDLDIKIKSSAGIHIFRIIQEAIQNAVKHAQCKNIETSIESSNGTLIINIEDNGIGMKMNDQSGYRMKTMKDRALQIGATIEIISAIGTRIELNFPLDSTT